MPIAIIAAISNSKISSIINIVFVFGLVFEDGRALLAPTTVALSSFVVFLCITFFKISLMYLIFYLPFYLLYFYFSLASENSSKVRAG